MFKKLNVKTLIIILLVLAGIYFVSTMTGNKERSFKDMLVEIDTAKVSKINILVLKDNLEITLAKTGQSDWEVSGNGKNYPADRSIVQNILSQFTEMKPERLAATSNSKWNAFEVSDSTGTRVVLSGNGKELADIYIGKFSYTQPPQTAQQNQYQQQQRGKMTSFVRLADDKDVYAVDGFLKMAYQNDINAYRNKTLVNVSKTDISRLEFKYPDRAITLVKENNAWTMNGQPADSANTVKYLNSIYRLSSPNFVDVSTQKISDATHHLTIEGSNFSPVQLKAFPAADTAIQYVVTSSLNPGAEFDGSKATLYEKVFVDETAFLPNVE
jgi:hypothetical protein